jgi:hypothetical protein
VFAQRQEPGEEEQFEASVKVAWLQTDAPAQEVDPLLGVEVASTFSVLFQVESSDLDRSKMLDPKWIKSSNLL